MDEDFSDGQTVASSFEIQQELVIKTLPTFSMKILQAYLSRLKQSAFKKILSDFLPYHPEKFQRLIQKAHQLFRQGKFYEANQYAQLSLKCIENNDNSSFQRVIYLMVQSLLQKDQIIKAKELIKKVQHNDQVIFQHKYLLLMMKISQVEHDQENTKVFFRKLQYQIDKNQTIDRQEISQIVIFCGDTLLKLDLRNETFSFLLKWLPILIGYGNSQNRVIAKIYIQLAEICERNKNLQHQFTYLCCASLTIFNQLEHQFEYLDIECKKLANLFARTLPEKAAQQLQNIFSSLPTRTSKNSAHKQELKRVASDLLSQIQYNGLKISKKQRQHLQMLYNVSQFSFRDSMSEM